MGEEYLKYLKNTKYWNGKFKARGPMNKSLKIEENLKNLKIDEAPTISKAGAEKENDKAKVFKLFDQNKDGFITKEEFSKVSKNISKETIDAVFAKFDSNGDGKLCLEEFEK